MSETDPIYNAPGQSALAYRITEQPQSFARMVSRLHSYTITSGPNSGTQPLAQITTRDSADPAVALLDACAAVFDVLSFYQERLVNEAYLRTATEPYSVLQLARMVGYQPAPALSASTYLSFTIDSAPTTPATITVPAGTQVKSVPAQGQLPQTFETVSPITASALYNQLLPQDTRPQTVITSSDGSAGDVPQFLRLDGVATRLRPGDLLSVGDSTVVRVTQLTTNIKAKYTDVQVELVTGPAVRLSVPPLASSLPMGDATTLPAQLNSQTTTDYLISHSFTDTALAAAIGERGWSAAAVRSQVQQALQTVAVAQPVQAYRQAVVCFGARALPWASLPKPSAGSLRGDDAYAAASSSWDVGKDPNDSSSPYDTKNKRTIWLDSFGNLYRSGAAGCDLLLERSVSGVLPGSKLLLCCPRGVSQYAVSATGSTTALGYGTTVLATGISVSAPPATQDAASTDIFLTRDTTVYLQSEALTLCSRVPLLADPTITSKLTLDSLIIGLVPGQPLLVTGQPVDSPGTTQTEVAFLASATHSGGYTTLYFSAPLSREYLQSTITVSANVAQASHGETVTQEVLGSGDGAQSNQRFALKRAPLSYLPAVAESGSRSTLQVRVNGVLWREVSTLQSLDARGTGYVIERDQSGAASILFGDGVHGARLPSGSDNVVATYRIGGGSEGQVGGGSLQLLLTRQLGLRSVKNPLPASGAAAAESTAVTRGNAPLKARSLGRAVSLSDYEALTGAYPDIAMVQANAVLLGGLPTVHLTVATADGSPLPESSMLYQSLLQSLRTLGNPTQSLALDDYQPVSFHLKARLRIDPRYLAAEVLDAAATALRDAFAFGRRRFAQPVYSSELLVLMHGIDGVLGVVLDALYRADGSVGLLPTLTASPAYVDLQGHSHGAELLQLELADSDLESLS